MRDSIRLDVGRSSRPAGRPTCLLCRGAHDKRLASHHLRISGPQAPERERLAGLGMMTSKTRRGETGMTTTSKARGWLIDYGLNMAFPGQGCRPASCAG